MRLLPNLLTLARLALAPFVFHKIWAAEFRSALWILAAAAFTDALDGFLARRFGWTSGPGAILDPIADKVLLSGVYLTMGVTGDVPLWLVGIIVVRDLLLVTGAAIGRRAFGMKAFPPSWLGKISTIVQIFTAVLVLTDRALPQASLIQHLNFFYWLTAAMAVLSGAHYYWRGWRELSARRSAAA